MSCKSNDAICMNPDEIVSQLSVAEVENIQTGKDTLLNQVTILSNSLDTKINTVKKILKSMEDTELLLKKKLNIKVLS